MAKLVAAWHWGKKEVLAIDKVATNFSKRRTLECKALPPIQETSWFHDLCEEGVEPNPGPRRRDLRTLQKLRVVSVNTQGCPGCWRVLDSDIEAHVVRLQEVNMTELDLTHFPAPRHCAVGPFTAVSVAPLVGDLKPLLGVSSLWFAGGSVVLPGSMLSPRGGKPSPSMLAIFCSSIVTPTVMPFIGMNSSKKFMSFLRPNMTSPVSLLETSMKNPPPILGLLWNFRVLPFLGLVMGWVVAGIKNNPGLLTMSWPVITRFLRFGLGPSGGRTIAHLNLCVICGLTSTLK